MTMKTGIAFFILCSSLCPGSLLLGGQKVKDYVSVAGVRTLHLKGIGIVAGLNGTGDSDKNKILKNKLGDFLSFWENQKNLDIQLGDLIQTNNCSLVLVIANVSSITKQGQAFQVEVSAIGDAKSLVGGHLLECALCGPIIPDQSGNGQKPKLINYAVAQGKVLVPQAGGVKTTGTCTAILERPFQIPFHSNYEFLTLLLDNPNFHDAYKIATAINTSPSLKQDLGAAGEPHIPLSSAIDSGSIKVIIPPQYRRRNESLELVDFVSKILDIDLPSRSKVLINPQNGSVFIKGRVLVKPFSLLVNGKVLQIPPPPNPDKNEPMPLDGEPVFYPLVTLLADFRQANIQPAEIINILKEMAQADVLEAELEEVAL